jgi:hypothetical protein
VTTHHRASRVLVKARAVCTGSADVRVAVDGHTVMNKRVRGARNYGARLSVAPGTHKVSLTTSRATGGCGQALTADRVSLV